MRFELPAMADDRLGIAVVAAGSFDAKPAALAVRERTLAFHAAVHVAAGHGTFESPSAGRREIVPGSMFWLFPGEPHSYAPRDRWMERWIVFGGTMADLFESNGLLDRREPVVRAAGSREVTALFDEVRDILAEGGPLAALASGAKIPTLVALAAAASRGIAADDGTPSDVARALRCIESEALGGIDPRAVATRIGVGYSTLRRHFRRQTGMGLKEYILRVRVRRAKELLAQTHLTIAEVAEKSGFDDAFHFSRLFRRYEGLAPTAYRRTQAEWAGMDSRLKA